MRNSKNGNFQMEFHGKWVKFQEKESYQLRFQYKLQNMDKIFPISYFKIVSIEGDAVWSN